MYSWRARIGMLLPSSNAACEPQIQNMLPDGVTFHTTRLRLLDSSEESVRGMTERLEEGASLLADAGVDLIVFHCTAVTMYRPGMDDEIIDRITRATGKPATATSKAVLEAFKALGVRRVVLTTPYNQATNDREVAFLESHQIKVLSERGYDVPSKDGGMMKVDPGDWYRRVAAQKDDTTDAYFVSCTAIRSAEVIEPIERDFGKPVVTSNQAMVWHALRKTGVKEPVAGYGRLFAV